jgi:hypothetical protein
VNLSELALGFGGSAQTDSHYKRLQRFFRHYVLEAAKVAQRIVALLNIPEPWAAKWAAFFESLTSARIEISGCSIPYSCKCWITALPIVPVAPVTRIFISQVLLRQSMDVPILF